MTRQSISLDKDLYEYLLSCSLRENRVLGRIREDTENHPLASMQIAPEQGQFMALLIQLMGATRAIEVGVFTGYSTLVTALAMPDHGRIVACEINEEFAQKAREYWREAGALHKIDLRIGLAIETLDALLADGQAGAFDFGFIDADKENDHLYFERLYELVRPGGLIVVDNTLWSGRVADEDADDLDTVAIRAFNEALRNDERIALSMLPVGDGLTLAMKL